MSSKSDREVGKPQTVTSSPFRRDGTDGGSELCMHIRINGSIFDFGAGRILAKVVVAVPILGWPDRSRHETTAAIWTNVIQDGVDTRTAERTFVTAYARLQRIGRQGLVAVLASWS